MNWQRQTKNLGTGNIENAIAVKKHLREAKKIMSEYIKNSTDADESLRVCFAAHIEKPKGTTQVTLHTMINEIDEELTAMLDGPA